MAGQITGTSHLLQLLHHRLPPESFLGRGDICRHYSSGCCGCCAVGLHTDLSLGFCQRVGFLLCQQSSVLRIGSRILCGSRIYCRRLAALLERHLTRRQTVLFIACSILEVDINNIVGLGELHFLNKFTTVFKIAELHLEKRVVVGNLTTHRLQLTYQFHTIELVDMERSLYRSVLSQFGGINVPAGSDRSGKHNFRLGSLTSLERRCELNRMKHLRLSHKGKEQHAKYT